MSRRGVASSGDRLSVNCFLVRVRCLLARGLNEILSEVSGLRHLYFVYEGII